MIIARFRSERESETVKYYSTLDIAINKIKVQSNVDYETIVRHDDEGTAVLVSNKTIEPNVLFCRNEPTVLTSTVYLDKIEIDV